MCLVLLLVSTAATGAVLHLGRYGLVAESHEVFRIVHWALGLATALAAAVHVVRHRWRLARCPLWFRIVTGILLFCLIDAAGTGLLLLTVAGRLPMPVLWHCGFGVALTVAAALHLTRGIRAWRRMYRRYPRRSASGVAESLGRKVLTFLAALAGICLWGGLLLWGLWQEIREIAGFGGP